MIKLLKASYMINFEIPAFWLACLIDCHAILCSSAGWISSKIFSLNYEQAVKLLPMYSTCIIWMICHRTKDSLVCRWGIVISSYHDDVIKWKHFPRYWPFVWEIHRSSVNSPHRGQWRGALMFVLICVWINGWVNNRKAGDLRGYRAHYDVIVMYFVRWTQMRVMSHYNHTVSDHKHFHRVFNSVFMQTTIKNIHSHYWSCQHSLTKGQ